MTEKQWTAEKDEQLLALRAAGLKWYVIAKKLGRTEAATISRAGTLKSQRPAPENAGSAAREIGDRDLKQNDR
jgi:hypothetical protein